MITFDNIVAETPKFKALIICAQRYAKTNGTILINGPTGAGKSYIAEAIHHASPRHKFPFVKINCANLSESLLESELFGHEKGAFTDATTRKIGKFEYAKGGTIFLDEIAELSLSLQSKLLRIIEDRTFERLGGVSTIKSDVRIISATNKNLYQMVADGNFREDLLFRINVLPLNMLSLSERKKCLEKLSYLLLDTLKKEYNKFELMGFTSGAISLIESYSWPGNVRQLKNTIERAVILTDGNYITEYDLEIENTDNFLTQPIQKSMICESGGNARQFNKLLILNALDESNWVQKNAAAKLGMTPRALNYQIKKFNISHPTWIVNK